MIAQFNKMHDVLEEAHDDENTYFRIDKCLSFAMKAAKYEKMLRWIKKPTVMMQKRGCTLCYCSTNLKMLIHDVQTNSTVVNHDLFRCTLSDVYIGEGSDKLSDPLFESGVIKIQNDDIANMSDEEHAVCERLLLNVEEQSLNNSAGPNA